MADADAAIPPPPQPPPPGWRSIAAAMVPSRYALAAATAAAIIYLILGMDWVLFASLGVWRVGRAACVESCAAVAAADGVSSFAMVSLVVLALVAIIAAAVCSIFVSGNTEDERAPPINDPVPPEDQPVLHVLLLGMLALMAFVLVTVLGFLVKAFSPFRGSGMDGFGSLIVDVGVLCIVLLNCFIVVPALAMFVWKRMLVIWQRI